MKLACTCILTAWVVTLAGCADNEVNPITASPDRVGDEVGAFTAAHIVPTYSEERPGTFVDMEDSLLWEHIVRAEQTAVIGLRRPGVNRGIYRGRVLMDQTQWLHARHGVASRPGVELIWVDTLLPTVKVRFATYEAFQLVRRLPITDYIEPLRAKEDVAASANGVFVCGNINEWGAQRLYTNGTWGDVYSMKHRAMGIENAWRRTGGAGVSIGVVDTGTHPGQHQLLPASLGGAFADGESGGRWIRFRDAWNGNADVAPRDDCGHGTEAAGVVVAPRDGVGPVGVAWKSNFVSARHGNGAIAVDANDAQHAIRAALSAMEGESGGKIISMSWQSLNWWWQVSNEIEWWQNRYPNRLLFFGAAGTTLDDWQECGAGALIAGFGVAGAVFLGWNPYLAAGLWILGGVTCVAPNNSNILFPASHPNVVAVTCVDYPIGTVSNNCHYGGKVEFSAYQAFPTVHGSSPTIDRLSGSSGATPVVAGQAALVWSRYPHFTRGQVLDRMRWAGRPSRDPQQGYGIVNSYKAVGGIYRVTVVPTLLSGGGFNEVAYYQLSVEIRGGDGPFTYRWNTGATSPTIQAAIGPNEPNHVYTVTITDTFDGGTSHGFAELAPPPGGCEDPTQIIC